MRAPTLRLVTDQFPNDYEIETDNFAGGGGWSLGLELALGRSPAVAINHDPEALAMHRANHPDTEHYCEDVFDVDPVAVCRGRKVGLAVFSPDCKHHSKAKGGPPIRDKEIRGLAWVVVDWAKLVRPRIIFLENVEEFLNWGPLDKKGKIIKRRKGEEFAYWWKRMEHLGYKGEFKILRACDYGAPTSRKRLFVIWRCDGQPIVWPKPTHGPAGSGLLPFRTAADCIDFDLKCPSIFLTPEEAKEANVRRPLADKTLKRIARGLRKYVFGSKRPFIVPVSHGEKGDNVRPGHDLNDPVKTITGANRGELALVTPYIAGVGGRQGCSIERSVDRPYQTTTTKADSVVVAPTLIQTGYGERPGQAPRCLDLGTPLGTVMSGGSGGVGKHALVTAFLAKHFGDRPTGGWAGGADATKPFGVVTTKDHHSLVTSNLVKLRGTSEAHMDASSLPTDSPAPTVSASGWHLGEVRAFLTKYYGNGSPEDLNEPLDTLTTKERFGLVTIEGQDYQMTDIGMRMLIARELFRAQGFPDSYIIDPVCEYTRTRMKGRGKNRREVTTTYSRRLSGKAQVKMCGNSVCPPLAEQIVRANYTPARVHQLAAVA